MAALPPHQHVVWSVFLMLALLLGVSGLSSCKVCPWLPPDGSGGNPALSLSSELSEVQPFSVQPCLLHLPFSFPTPLI